MADPALAATAASIARQDSSVSGRHAPPRHGVARSRNALGRRSLSPSSRNTGTSRGPSTSIVPRQVVVRSIQRSTRGSTDRTSSPASSSAIGTPSAWTAATATEPAGPSSSSSAPTRASARASGAWSEPITIQLRPRRSRRNSTSKAGGATDGSERATGARTTSVRAWRASSVRRSLESCSEHSRRICRGLLVDRQQPSLDRGHAIGGRMLEQKLDEVRRAVGREAEPPVVVGPGEIDQELSRRALGLPARERAAERIGDVHRIRARSRTTRSVNAPDRGRAAPTRPVPRDPSAAPESSAGAAAGDRRRETEEPPLHSRALRRRLRA